MYVRCMLSLTNCTYLKALAHFYHIYCLFLQTKGFVNYYGPQRFGQGQNVQTDQIGLALLNEKMVLAFCNIGSYCQVNDTLLVDLTNEQFWSFLNNYMYVLQVIARSVLTTA